MLQPLQSDKSEESIQYFDFDALPKKNPYACKEKYKIFTCSIKDKLGKSLHTYQGPILYLYNQFYPSTVLAIGILKSVFLFFCEVFEFPSFPPQSKYWELTGERRDEGEPSERG